MTVAVDLPANVYGGTDLSVLASNQLAVDVSAPMLQNLFIMAKTGSDEVNFLPITIEICGSETVSLAVSAQSYLEMKNPATIVQVADVSTFFASDNSNCPITSY